MVKQVVVSMHSTETSFFGKQMRKTSIKMQLIAVDWWSLDGQKVLGYNCLMLIQMWGYFESCLKVEAREMICKNI